MSCGSVSLNPCRINFVEKDMRHSPKWPELDLTHQHRAACVHLKNGAVNADDEESKNSNLLPPDVLIVLLNVLSKCQLAYGEWRNRSWQRSKPSLDLSDSHSSSQFLFVPASNELAEREPACPWRLENKRLYQNAASTFKLMLDGINSLYPFYLSAIFVLLHWSPDTEIHLLVCATPLQGVQDSYRAAIRWSEAFRLNNIVLYPAVNMVIFQACKNRKERKCLLCPWVLLVLVCLINAAERSLLILRLYWSF